nr:MAG TPA: hypothetical protein [Bacteriophage sp.]
MNTNKAVHDEFTVREYAKALVPCISEIERVDVAGNPV